MFDFLCLNSRFLDTSGFQEGYQSLFEKNYIVLTVKENDGRFSNLFHGNFSDCLGSAIF
jgi:hypothetical protein